MSSRACRILTTISALLWAASLGAFCLSPYLSRELAGFRLSESLIVTVWNLDGQTAQHWLGCANAGRPITPGSLQDLTNVTRIVEWRPVGIKFVFKLNKDGTSHWTVWVNLWWPLALFAIHPMWALFRCWRENTKTNQPNASEMKTSTTVALESAK